jgi:hypothetical protein
MIQVQKLVFPVWICDGFLNQQTGVPQWGTGFANQSISQSDENPKSFSLDDSMGFILDIASMLVMPNCGSIEYGSCY